MIVTNILIDKGLALNECRLITKNQLGVGWSFIRGKWDDGKSFRWLQNVAVGELDLVLEIGPFQLEVPFIVIDIPVILNM